MWRDRNTQATERRFRADNVQVATPTPARHCRASDQSRPASRPGVRVAGSGSDPATCPAMANEPRDGPNKEVETAVMRLSLTVLGCHVTVQCEDAETRALLVANYGSLQGPRHPGDVRYVV